MKKISSKKKQYLKKQQVRRKKKEYRKSSSIRAKRLRDNSLLFGLNGTMLRFHTERTEFRKKFYRSKTYTHASRTIEITGEFGIEDSDNRDSFLKKASEIIDFENRELIFDISGCTRMWPSAVTLLCSLEQWVELSTWNRKIKPKLASTKSLDDKVNSYLHHCGFDNYVGIKSNEKDGYYNDCEVLKIRRETNQSNVEEREDEILDMLKLFTDFDKDQREIFHSVILEIFLNVSEHGVSGFDNGWWVLAQYHASHGIISVNIADNGIGIKNSLFTGPQQHVISKIYNFKSKNDGKLIKYATTPQVSGALTAVVKEKKNMLSRSRYPLGSKRGNGLDRIKTGCRRLGVELSILSHYGYLFYDSTGNEVDCGTMNNRVFAGTLYHLNVPAKKELAQ